jgi:peptide-methionine (S)-S-oxide reductase
LAGGVDDLAAAAHRHDPRRVSYGRILQIYFSIAHDRTELNRQGPDIGTQYRSAIFPINSEQQQLAEAYIAQLKRVSASISSQN